MNRVHSSCLMAICVFMFIVTGYAGLKTSPENMVETEERQDEAEESEKPENTTEESAAGDNVLAEKSAGAEEEAPSSFLRISPGTDEIEWAIYSESAYCYSDGSLWGYLSEDGEEIAPCIYEEAAPFSEGLACVCLDGKYGYIGKDGEEIIPFRYNQAASFREGAAYFSCGEEYGLIDPAGNVILDLTDSGCDSISSFREVLSPEYSDIQVGETDIIAQKDGKICLREENSANCIAWEAGTILCCIFTASRGERRIIRSLTAGCLR